MFVSVTTAEKSGEIIDLSLHASVGTRTEERGVQIRDEPAPVRGKRGPASVSMLLSVWIRHGAGFGSKTVVT